MEMTLAGADTIRESKGSSGGFEADDLCEFVASRLVMKYLKNS